MDLEIQIIVGDTAYDLSITDVRYIPGSPARTCGLPENCYPAEDGELEYVVELVSYCDENGDEWLMAGADAQQFALDHAPAVAVEVLKGVASYA